MNYNANIRVMRVEKRYGKGKGKGLSARLMLILCLFFVSCSRQVPILSENSLPISYDVTDAKSDAVRFVSAKRSIIQINGSVDLNERIITFWKRGRFNRLFKKYHPVVSYNRTDLEALKDALSRLLRVYYLDFAEKEDSEAIKRTLKHRIACVPLSNHELQFMMSSGVEDAFPEKTLTMLFISSHELLLSLGAKPSYPRIYSKYLRKQYHLPDVSPVENTNLFATKNLNDVYSANTSGFVFCRKGR